MNAPMAHDKDVMAITVTPDGRHVLSSDGGGTLYVWEAKTGALIHKTKMKAARFLHVSAAPDGASFVAGNKKFKRCASYPSLR